MTVSFDQLTESERACLRLVHLGLSSKQIAVGRNVRPDSIDRIILMARQKLGSPDRNEAARLLAEFEGTQAHSGQVPATPVISNDDPTTQSWGAPRLGVPDPNVQAPSDPGEQPGERSDRGLDTGSADRPDVSKKLAFHQLLLGSDRSPRNDLDMPLSVSAIAVVAAGAACVAVALISLVSALDPYAIGG